MYMRTSSTAAWWKKNWKASGENKQDITAEEEIKVQNFERFIWWTKWYLLWTWTGRITWCRQFSSKVTFFRRKVENSSTWISWMVSKASKNLFGGKHDTVSVHQLECARSVLSKWHRISVLCSETNTRIQKERCCNCEKESIAAKW